MYIKIIIEIYKHVKTTRIVRADFFSVLISFVVFCQACNTTPPVAPENSPVFQKQLSDATRVDDSGHYIRTLNLVDSLYRNQQQHYILDKYNYYSFKSQMYGRNFKDYEKVVLYTDSMIALFDNANKARQYNAKYVEAVYTRADALLAQGKYNDAFHEYYRGKMLANENSDSCLKSSYSYRLAMVLYRQERFKEAGSYFRESYAETKNCTEDFSGFYFKQELLDNIGLSFAGSGKFDSALVYYKNALAYIEDHTHKYPEKNENIFDVAIGVVYGNMADAYEKLGRPDTAGILLKKSIAINMQPGQDNNDARLTRLKLAKLYLKRHESAALENELATIKNGLDSFPNTVIRLGWYQLKWQYYQQQQQPAAALDYLKLYTALKDSTTLQNKGLNEADMDYRIRDMEKQYYINFLKKNRALDKVYLVIAILGTIMAVVIVILILRNWRGARKNVRVLTKLNNHIQDQKRALEQANSALEERDADKSRILRTVAHDVMNPINAISALADLLLIDADTYTEEQREMLGLIKEATSNSLTLSQDILEAANTMQPGKLQTETVDLNTLLKYCCDLLNFRAAAKNQVLTVNTPAEKIEVQVNRDKVWRAINNLVVNAIKFSNPGGAIEVRLEREDDYAHISIKDEGIGIPDKIKDVVFDMFTDAKRAGTSGEKPFGLGLAISKQVIELHQGKLWFDSVEHKGTTFHILLPVSK